MTIKSFVVDDGTPEGCEIQVFDGQAAKVKSVRFSTGAEVLALEYAVGEVVTYYPIGRIISIDVERDGAPKRGGMISEGL